MAIRITESQLRKIIRQEVRRLSEVAPGVRAPAQPGMDASELYEMMEALEGTDLDGGIDQALMNLNDYSGTQVGGLEEITDGSIVNTIAGFDYNPSTGVTVTLDTEHGATTLNLDDLAACCGY